MTRFGVLTDTHGPENLEVIAKALNKVGVSKAKHLGDWNYKTTDPLTIHLANAADQMQMLLSQDSPLQKDVLAARFKDEQLNTLKSYKDQALELTEDITTKQLEWAKQIFQNQGITIDSVLGGNHDRDKPLRKVFKDAFLDAQLQQGSNLNIVGLSGGGGRPAQTALNEGLMSDDQRLERWAHKRWQEILLKQDSIDLLLTHVPPTSGKGKVEENAIENLKQLLKVRASKGLSKPKAIMSGHTHTSTAVKFDDELDTLWIQPGVGALNHNKGQHAQYVTVDVDEASGLVNSVDEYRVYNNADGTQDVVHYATYQIDHQEKKVERNVVKKDVVTGFKPNPKDFLESDPNSQAKFSTNYQELDAQQKDLQVRRNIILGQQEAEKTAHEIKSIIETDRRKYLLNGKSENDLLKKNEDFQTAGERITKCIRAKAIQRSGINRANYNLETPQLQEFFEDLLTNQEFGLTKSTILNGVGHEDISVREFQKKVFNWGVQVHHTTRQVIGQRRQRESLSSLKAKDYIEMAQRYLPGNVTISPHIQDQDALGIYAKAFQNGPIPSGELLDNIWAKVDYASTTKPSDPLELTKYGVPEQFLQEESIKDIYQRLHTLLDEQLSIAQNNSNPVFKDSTGQLYLPRADQPIQIPKGYEQEFSQKYPFLQNPVDFNPQNLQRTQDGKQVYVLSPQTDTQGPQYIETNHLAHPDVRRIMEQREQQKLRENFLTENESTNDSLNQSSQYHSQLDA